MLQTRSLVGPIKNHYIHTYVRPQYGPAIHNHDCSSYRGPNKNMTRAGAYSSTARKVYKSYYKPMGKYPRASSMQTYPTSGPKVRK